MNATAPPDVIQVTDYQNGSDSDTNIDDDDDAPAVEFYQPVSAVDSEDDENQIGNDVVPIHSQLHSNGVTINKVDGGISSLQLNDSVGRNDRLNRSSKTNRPMVLDALFMLFSSRSPQQYLHQYLKAPRGPAMASLSVTRPSSNSPSKLHDLTDLQAELVLPAVQGPVFDPSLFKPSNQAKVYLRVQSPNAASLPTSFISNKSIELTQDANSVLKSSTVRSRTRIMVSSAQVVDQPSSKTGHVAPAVVDINLGNRSYSIYVGSGLLEQAELFQRHRGGGSQKESAVSQQIEGWRRHNS
ncbi:hypothetical protein EV1_043549 [Malus domestica]